MALSNIPPLDEAAMKIEEIISSLLDQIDDRESLTPPDDPDSIFKHDAEALREAVKILRAVEKEESRVSALEAQ